MRYLVLFLVFMASAYADETPQISGTGCPKGSVSVAFSPDFSAVSILFDRFTVEVGGASQPKKDSKFCAVSVPVDVPKGMQVAVTKIDYRGFFDLPGKARASLAIKNSFKGNGKGPGVTRDLDGPGTSEFLETNQVDESEVRWSPCGGLDGFDVVTTVTVHSPKERAMVTLDSEDASGSRGFVYRLQWRECTKKGKGGK